MILTSIGWFFEVVLGGRNSNSMLENSKSLRIWEKTLSWKRKI
jgi:hypothetical protein